MSLFDAPEITAESSAVSGSAMVKQLALPLATQIMAKIPGGDDEFLSLIKDSQTSVEALDKLVKLECGDDLNNEQVAAFDPEEAARILKSFQSTRSRRKSMSMTQSNYLELLTAAVGEWIVRISCDMKKSAFAFGAARQSMEINEDTVAALAENQEVLARAIRNVQSKKSTFKAKHADVEDYSDDPVWVELLRQEKLLKGARTTTGATRRGVSFKRGLQFIFDGVGETETLGKDECHAIIDACRALAKGIYPPAFLEALEAAEVEKAKQLAEEEGIDIANDTDVYAAEA